MRSERRGPPASRPSSSLEAELDDARAERDELRELLARAEADLETMSRALAARGRSPVRRTSSVEALNAANQGATQVGAQRTRRRVDDKDSAEWRALLTRQRGLKKR